MDKEVAILLKLYNCFMVPRLSVEHYLQEKVKIPNQYSYIIRPKITIKTVIKKGASIAYGIDADVYPYDDNTKEFPHPIEAV